MAVRPDAADGFSIGVRESASRSLLRDLDIDPTRDYQPTGKGRCANQRRKPKQAEP